MSLKALTDIVLGFKKVEIRGTALVGMSPLISYRFYKRIRSIRREESFRRSRQVLGYLRYPFSGGCIPREKKLAPVAWSRNISLTFAGLEWGALITHSARLLSRAILDGMAKFGMQLGYIDAVNTLALFLGLTDAHLATSQWLDPFGVDWFGWIEFSLVGTRSNFWLAGLPLDGLEPIPSCDF